MLEVFTIGGGEYIVNVLNAVAAWCGGGGFRSMLQVTLVMGFAYVLMVVAFTMDWRVWFRWFCSATLMYMCMIVPTTSVKVTDRVNPSLAPAVVDNVPIGLAAIAAFTSQIGDWMTTTAETVFVMPADLQLSTNGFIYGARLYDKTRDYVFNDPRVRANVEEYYKQCLFYDFMLGFKNIKTVADSPDLWDAVGPGSPARGMKYFKTDLSTEIKTCQAGYTQLGLDIAGAADDGLNIEAHKAFPKMAQAAARAKLEGDIPSISGAFHGTGQDASTLFKQRALIDAFLEARANLGDADGDTFAMLRADEQARNTYVSISQQAMTWVPLLNIVLTVVFYAMFPVIFPLFLMPTTGVAAMKGYVTGFFYLAAWGPLYAVLHMFIMGRAMASMAATSDVGVTMASMSGIDAVNADTSTIAGFLLMSVPFIAAGMAKGAMGVAGNATSMLAPAQSAAEAAAVERTTGNYAYGNVSYQNMTANTVQRDQWNTASNYTAGASGFHARNNEGGTAHSYADSVGGYTVYDTGGAVSQLPWTFHIGQSATLEMRQAESRHREIAQQIGETLDRGYTTSERTYSGNEHNHAVSNGSDNRDTRAQAVGFQRYKGQSNAASRSNERQESNADTTRVGSTESVSDSTTVTTSVGGRLSGGASVGTGGTPGLSANVGASASLGIEKSGSQRVASDRSVDKGITSSNTVSESTRRSQEQNSGTRKSVDDTNTESRGKFDSDTNSDVTRRGHELSRDERESLTRQQSEHLRKADALDRLASYSQSNDWRLNENAMPIIQPLYEQLRQSNTGMKIPDLMKVNLSGQEREARNWAIEKIITGLESDRVEEFRAAQGLTADVPRVQSKLSDNDGGPGLPRGNFPAPSSIGSSADVARGAGVAVKPGANIAHLDPRVRAAVPIVSEVASDLGLPKATITSGNDSRHMDGSRHYRNEALDFRGNNITRQQGEQWERAVRERLGPGYFVDYEYDPANPANRHLHVQLKD